MDFLEIVETLRRRVDALSFGPPAVYVYNPLDYASAPHRSYWEKYGGGTKEVLLVGMNPGPWGMAQTGVPFGAVSAVRDWMGIEEPVGRPLREHPKRPVTGFACRRTEASGKRLWGWAADRFGTPENFFARFFVANYCPLLFFDEAGANLTPDKLRAADRLALEDPCDEALRRTAELLKSRLVVGVGGYAEAGARRALAGSGLRVGRITHPSPANPAANRGWVPLVERELAALGVELP
jgi:single-strand selective monofunctional uracil DNA glycosylase